jgi:hypothetical protein
VFYVYVLIILAITFVLSLRKVRMKCSYTTLFHKFRVVWLDSIDLVFYGYVLIILAITIVLSLKKVKMKCSYTTLFHRFSVVWLDSIDLVFYGYVLIILSITFVLFQKRPKSLYQVPPQKKFCIPLLLFSNEFRKSRSTSVCNFSLRICKVDLDTLLLLH